MRGFKRFNVYLGIVNRIFGTAEFGEYVKSSRVRIHKKYRPTSFNNDIGMIILKTSTPEILDNKFIGLCPLPKSQDKSIDFGGKEATVSGFGVISDRKNDGPSQFLRFATVTIQNCILYYYEVPGTVLCSIAQSGISPCPGDSGGPLTFEIEQGRKILIGVVSFASKFGCEKGLPVGYARVTAYLDWIEEFVDVVPKSKGSRKIINNILLIISLIFLKIIL